MVQATKIAASKYKQPKFSPSQYFYIAAIVTDLVVLGGCGPKETEPHQNPTTSNPLASTPASAPQPAPAKEPDNETASLQRLIEQVLKCSDAPIPKNIARLLQQAGFIQFNKYEWVDSVTYFPTLKPFEVWGMEVTHVFGYDNDRKIFSRGPGTAPPTHFGIVVPHSVEAVKKKIPGGDAPSDIRPSSVDLNSPQRSLIRTDIECTA